MSRKGWIGIEMGTRTLKVVQLERARGKLRIAASAIVYRSASSRDGSAAGEGYGWSGLDLRAALALDPGFSGRQAACVLPMQRTHLHAFTIPPGDRSEQRAMLVHELSTAASESEEPCEFDFWEVEGASANSAASGGNVCAMSASHRMVAEVTRCLSQAGLACEVLDGLPFALTRAVTLAYGPASAAPVAAIEWGYASGTFCLISAGTLLFTRHLRNCGLGTLVDAVRRALNVAEEDVRQLLMQYGLPDPERRSDSDADLQQIIAEAAEIPLAEMAEELRKTLAYVRMQFGGINPDRLCLLGAGASVRHAGSFFSRAVGAPVDLWRLPEPAAHDASSPATGPESLGIAAALSALAWTT